MMGVSGDAKPIPFIEDCSVSTEKLPEYIRRVDQMIRENGTVAAYYGHASVGCILVRPFINLKQQADVDRMYNISREASDLVMEMGGAMSGEHGDGLVRSMWNEKVFGSRLYTPSGTSNAPSIPRAIMNPGKIVDSQRIVENLRYALPTRALRPRPSSASPPRAVSTARWRCATESVSVRRTLDGTMCPSYMATREEEHSTRGRANALRAAISGLPSPG